MEETKVIVVEGVAYECPPPHPLLRVLARQLVAQWETEGITLDTLSYILGFAERRGWREAMLEIERFIVRHEKT